MGFSRYQELQLLFTIKKLEIIGSPKATQLSRVEECSNSGRPASDSIEVDWAGQAN